MVIRANLAALGRMRWYEYLIRFVLGGLTTVVAGMIAEAFGPATGGLFLAFPALFCAGVTLVERHERERKQSHGLSGDTRGRGAAALDSAGAGWGSIALAAFAAVVAILAPRGAGAALGAGCLVWIAAAAGLWLLRRKTRRSSRT